MRTFIDRWMPAVVVALILNILGGYYLRAQITQPGLPTGALVAFTTGSCPSGWTENTASRGLYIVGLQSGGTNAGTSGTALTNLEARAVGQHTHSLTMNAHNHGITDPGHTHTVTVFGNIMNDSFIQASATSAFNTPVSTSSSTTGITINNTTSTGTIANSGSVAGTNAPYIQYIICKPS